MIGAPHLAHDFQRHISEAIAAHGKHLADGKAADWEDYKRRCGQIAGLQQALLIFGDLLKAYVETNYDED